MLPEKQSDISILNALFYRWQFLFLALAVVLMVSLTAGCNSSPTTPEASQEFPNPLPSPTIFPTPLPTIQVTPSPTQIVPTPTPGFQICTPLSGYELSELSDMIVNPYTAPPPGSDMPHEGIDLAVVLAQTGIAMEGNPVHALLPGTVAVSLQNRFPYGNALIIETPLEQLPPQSIEQLVLPAPIPTLPAHPSLTCPTTDSNIDEAWQVDQRSLYLVYAHLKDPPSLQPGEAVACGDILGTIGATGNALNPHLHLEARVGPSGMQLASMAHYTGSATPEEMEAYCLWRVSGWFLLINPLDIITLQR